jgi:hypothetical protein
MLVMLSGASPAQADAQIAWGLWELEIATQTRGMPLDTLPHRLTQCLRPDDPVPQTSDRTQCQILEQRVRGNTLQWEVRCPSASGLSYGRGQLRFEGTRARGELNMGTATGAGEVQTTTTFVGRRVGECE